MAYKYKPIKWSIKKLKIYDHECDGNKSTFIGMYEDEDSSIGRNNNITYRVEKIKDRNLYLYPRSFNNITEETVYEKGFWHLEITIRDRQDLIKQFLKETYTNLYIINYKFSTKDECILKAEELNKKWNNQP